MNPAESLPPPRYEPNPGSPAWVVVSAVAIAVCVGLVLFVAASVAPPRSFLPGTDAGYSFHHGPEARSSIAQDWAEQDTAVREHLETYGWNDRAAGVARIPIERAMELVSRDAGVAAKKAQP